MQKSTTTVPGAPVHMLSALVVIALDWIWGFVEKFATISVVGIVMLPILSITVFFVTFLAVLFIQRVLDRDRLPVCAAKGVALGIVAAVPYQVIGTVVGVPLLAWAGINQLTKK
jgi:hypothetical protein